MIVRIDEKLLEEVSRKTGQSTESLLGELQDIAQAHLNKLLGEPEQAGPQIMPMDTFMEAGRKIADKHAEAFRELAK